MPIRVRAAWRKERDRIVVLGRFFKLDQGVEKTRGGLFSRFADLFGRAQIDEDLWDELEEILIGSDVGVPTTEQVMKNLRHRVAIGAVTTPRDLRRAIQEELVDILDIAATDDPLVDGTLTA